MLHMVKKIFNNYGSNSANINTVYLTLLNNETINSSSSIVDVDVLVTDDMGNEIFGKIVPVDLNDTRVGNVSITDGDVSIAISNPGEGTYLVNGNYTGALNTIIKTGVITFLEPYTGPFYVATNGSDSNNGMLIIHLQQLNKPSKLQRFPITLMQYSLTKAPTMNMI